MTKRYFFSIIILFSVLSYASSEIQVIDSSECADMSGLRDHWDMAIPVAENGKQIITDNKVKDRGATVVFNGVELAETPDRSEPYANLYSPLLGTPEQHHAWMTIRKMPGSIRTIQLWRQ